MVHHGFFLFLGCPVLPSELLTDIVIKKAIMVVCLCFPVKIMVTKN